MKLYPRFCVIRSLRCKRSENASCYTTWLIFYFYWQNGVAGSFWYSSAAVINMILFPMLSVQFKTRAPGAKTFLQVIEIYTIAEKRQIQVKSIQNNTLQLCNRQPWIVNVIIVPVIELEKIHEFSLSSKLENEFNLIKPDSVFKWISEW